MESLKIVLASPSDLQDERKLITNMINRKDRLYKRYNLTIDLRRWEDTAPGASEYGGQGIIDNDLEIERADIFICMYWEKAGTVIDQLNETGTEHELNKALEVFSNTGKPDIKLLIKKSNNREVGVEKIIDRARSKVLYQEFSNLEELNNIIDQIVTQECNRIIQKTQNQILEKKNKKYIEIELSKELINAFDSENSIVLRSGFYNMLEGDDSEKAHFEDVFDGKELVIEEVNNLTIMGNHSNLVVEPRYAAVLTFKNCESIVLKGLTIGHTPHKGDCSGPVLRFENCSNVILSGLELFGCGTYGLESYYSDITLNGCHIFDCSYGAMHLVKSDVRVENTLVSECKDITGSLFELSDSYLNLTNVLIRDNRMNSSVFSIMDSNIYGVAVSLIDNMYSELGTNELDFYCKGNLTIG